MSFEEPSESCNVGIKIDVNSCDNGKILKSVNAEGSLQNFLKEDLKIGMRVVEMEVASLCDSKPETMAKLASKQSGAGINKATMTDPLPSGRSPD